MFVKIHNIDEDWLNVGYIGNIHPNIPYQIEYLQVFTQTQADMYPNSQYVLDACDNTYCQNTAWWLSLNSLWQMSSMTDWNPENIQDENDFPLFIENIQQPEIQTQFVGHFVRVMNWGDNEFLYVPHAEDLGTLYQEHLPSLMENLESLYIIDGLLLNTSEYYTYINNNYGNGETTNEEDEFFQTHWTDLEHDCYDIKYTYTDDGNIIYLVDGLQMEENNAEHFINDTDCEPIVNENVQEIGADVVSSNGSPNYTPFLVVGGVILIGWLWLK